MYKDKRVLKTRIKIWESSHGNFVCYPQYRSIFGFWITLNCIGVCSNNFDATKCYIDGLSVSKKEMAVNEVRIWLNRWKKHQLFGNVEYL